MLSRRIGTNLDKKLQRKNLQERGEKEGQNKEKNEDTALVLYLQDPLPPTWWEGENDAVLSTNLSITASQQSQGWDELREASVQTKDVPLADIIWFWCCHKTWQRSDNGLTVQSSSADWHLLVFCFGVCNFLFPCQQISGLGRVENARLIIN